MTAFLCGSLLQREFRQPHDRPALQRGFMGADADAGPIGARHRVRPRIAVFDERAHEFMHEVRMRAPVAAALDERQMLGVVNLLRQRELADRQTGLVKCTHVHFQGQVAQERFLPRLSRGFFTKQFRREFFRTGHLN